VSLSTPTDSLNHPCLRPGCPHESKQLEHCGGLAKSGLRFPISLDISQNLRPELAGTVARAAVIGACNRLVSYLQLQRIRDGGKLGRCFFAAAQSHGKGAGRSPSVEVVRGSGHASRPHELQLPMVGCLLVSHAVVDIATWPGSAGVRDLVTAKPLVGCA
jgi:hypothetical protein